MDITVIILLVVLFFSLITNVFLIWLYIKINSYIRQYNENTQDSVKAISDMMSYIVKELSFNSEAHKTMQEWQEKNLAALSTLNTENAQKIYDTIMQYQGYLNRLGEFMGYRPRGTFE